MAIREEFMVYCDVSGGDLRSIPNIEPTNSSLKNIEEGFNTTKKQHLSVPLHNYGSVQLFSNREINFG